MTKEEIFKELKKPFKPTEIDWRLGSCNTGKTSAMALAYLKSRAVMERLDAVVGPENWNDNLAATDKGIICSLTLVIEGLSITKSDGAHYTDIEAFKGGCSDSFKRAAVKFGIGRYLYSLENIWVDLHKGKFPGSNYAKVKNEVRYWAPPKLPEWAIPASGRVIPEGPYYYNVEKSEDLAGAEAYLEEMGASQIVAGFPLWKSEKSCPKVHVKKYMLTESEAKECEEHFTGRLLGGL